MTNLTATKENLTEIIRTLNSAEYAFWMGWSTEDSSDYFKHMLPSNPEAKLSAAYSLLVDYGFEKEATKIASVHEDVVNFKQNSTEHYVAHKALKRVINRIAKIKNS